MLNGAAVTAYIPCSHCSGRDMQNIRLVRDEKGKGRRYLAGGSSDSLGLLYSKARVSVHFTGCFAFSDSS